MVTLDVQKKLEKAEQQEAYTAAYQMIIADPTNNLQAAKEIMYKKMMPDLTSDEIKRIITPPEQEPITGAALPEQLPIEQPADINPEMADMGAEATLADAQATEEQPIYG